MSCQRLTSSQRNLLQPSTRGHRFPRMCRRRGIQDRSRRSLGDHECQYAPTVNRLDLPPSYNLMLTLSQEAISWVRLADDVLGGRQITEDEAVAVLESPDDELLDLLAAAF